MQSSARCKIMKFMHKHSAHAGASDHQHLPPLLSAHVTLHKRWGSDGFAVQRYYIVWPVDAVTASGGSTGDVLPATTQSQSAVTGLQRLRIGLFLPAGRLKGVPETCHLRVHLRVHHSEISFKKKYTINAVWKTGDSQSAESVTLSKKNNSRNSRSVLHS